MLKSPVLNSLKAISIGITSILILGLVNQLVLIMALVGYNALVKVAPDFAPWSQVFTYSIGGLGYFIVMLCAGLFTAIASQQHHYRHAVIAAALGSSLSLYLSLQEEIFTPLALLFLLLGVVFALFGCWLWLKYEQKNN
jgi:hypothetical protein